jgi:hypothetical protein
LHPEKLPCSFKYKKAVHLRTKMNHNDCLRQWVDNLIEHAKHGLISQATRRWQSLQPAPSPWRVRVKAAAHHQDNGSDHQIDRLAILLNLNAQRDNSQFTIPATKAI